MLVAILALVALVVVVVVAALMVLVVALAVAVVVFNLLGHRMEQSPVRAAVALVFWVKAQAEMVALEGLTLALAVAAVAAARLDKAHLAPHMLAHQGVEPMAGVVAVSVVLLTPEAVMALLERFALSGPAVLAHSHQLVRETYK